jgi:hypothetical protein
VFLVLGGALWWEWDDLRGETIDPGTPVPPAQGLTVEEAAFYGYVAPRLRVVAAEARKLEDLGRAKSRNVVELTRRGDRIDEVSQQIDEYAAVHAVPARFASAQERYATGIREVRQAIEESRTAFVTFDWDRVARAVETMERGANDLERATVELERLAGNPDQASPGASGKLGRSSLSGN